MDLGMGCGSPTIAGTPRWLWYTACVSTITAALAPLRSWAAFVPHSWASLSCSSLHPSMELCPKATGTEAVTHFRVGSVQGWSWETGHTDSICPVSGVSVCSSGVESRLPTAFLHCHWPSNQPDRLLFCVRSWGHCPSLTASLPLILDSVCIFLTLGLYTISSSLHWQWVCSEYCFTRGYNFWCVLWGKRVLFPSTLPPWSPRPPPSYVLIFLFRDWAHSGNKRQRKNVQKGDLSVTQQCVSKCLLSDN